MLMNDVFLRYPGGLEKAAAFSYDDGTVTDKKLVEIFDKYGLKGTFNLNSGRLDGNDNNLSRDEAVSLFKNSSHEVAVHGYSHPFYDLMPIGMGVRDIICDREKLENIFEKPICGMAYPNSPVTAENRYSDEVENMLKICGISYARTSTEAKDFRLPKNWLKMPVTCHHDNPKLFELAKNFAETKVDRIPRLFYVWGHSIEFENNNNWYIMEQLGEYLSEFNDIWFATNMEIYNYVKAYESLVFTADGKRVFNPSGQIVYIMKNYNVTTVLPMETKII